MVRGMNLCGQVREDALSDDSPSDQLRDLVVRVAQALFEDLRAVFAAGYVGASSTLRASARPVRTSTARG